MTAPIKRHTRSFYPAFLDLRGRQVVVIGGGSVAAHKVFALLQVGAKVRVVSGDLTHELTALGAERTIEVWRRPYRMGDLAGAWLAIAATDDRAVNRRVWAEAERRGILLNAVDDLRHSSFIAPAVHREGDIMVAVSTGGKSPALAVRLRERIARLIGRTEARLCELLGELRPEIAARIPDARRRTDLWYRAIDSDLIEFVRRDDIRGARRRIEELMSERARRREAAFPRPRGVVYLVGAGPGDAGLITVRGLELLRSAEVVVYDRLVARALVQQAPLGAERVFVGRRAYEHGTDQEAINALLIDRARRGRLVVRLKGGDPFVFGRGAEECEALRAAGVSVQVVSGVTSAIAVPAALGIPVTDRRHASGFAVVTGHECEGEREGNSDLDWSALARVPTLVVLMGLRALARITGRLIVHGADPKTPAAVIASGTLPEERTVVGTLATIAELTRNAGLEPPATVIIGEVVRHARCNTVSAALDGVPTATLHRSETARA